MNPINNIVKIVSTICSEWFWWHRFPWVWNKKKYVSNISFEKDCNLVWFSTELSKMLLLPRVRGQIFHSVPQNWCSMTKKKTFPCRWFLFRDKWYSQCFLSFWQLLNASKIIAQACNCNLNCYMKCPNRSTEESDSLSYLLECWNVKITIYGIIFSWTL